jgi:hypothetical protein
MLRPRFRHYQIWKTQVKKEDSAIFGKNKTESKNIRGVERKPADTPET